MYGTCCEYDKWSNWWCYVVEINYCASMLLYEFKILSSNYSMAWLYNSSAISWEWWLALTVGPAPAVRVMMISHHHHTPCQQKWGPGYWRPNGLWGKYCAGLRRTPVVDGDGTNTRGPNQISTVISRTFWTLNLLSLRRQMSHSKPMSGSIPLSRSFGSWGL